MSSRETFGVVESKTVVIYGTYRGLTGDLVHRAFSGNPDAHPFMRLVPCINYWVPRDHYKDVALYPTCLRCVGARGYPP